MISRNPLLETVDSLSIRPRLDSAGGAPRPRRGRRRRPLHIRVLALLLLGCLATQAVRSEGGVPAPNDRFGDAAELPGNLGKLVASNRDATRESDEVPLSPLASGRTLWWRWTPETEGTATVFTAGSNFRTALAVYTGDALTDLELVAIDASASEQARASNVTFAASAEETYRIAVDGVQQDSGDAHLTWHVADPALRPVNDDFAAAPTLTGSAGELLGSSLGGTLEAGEPAHSALPHTSSVWWQWTAPESGVVTLHTGGSSFDTLLGVYAGEELATLEVIAQDDNSGLDRASVAVFSVEEGRVYHFAVAGLLQESGVISLRWRFQVPCHGPGALVAPSPAPDDTGVAANVVLEWSQLDTTTRPVIYGEDDRREIYEIDDPGLFAAWEATAALVWDHRLSENDDGTFALLADTFSAFYGLCPDEPYFDQPVPPAHCTGFLVADDLLVTAGHCLNGQRDCEDVVFVFGFRMLDADTPVLTFHGSQIFRCAEVIVRQVQMPNRIDWALVRLDRPVTDRIPLELRRSGEVADQQPIVVVGHPGGLPAKVAAGAEVRSNVAAGYFDANLDTYQGNSGSPVLNADTLVVEGMLIRGDKDFVPQEADGDCRVSKRCEDDQCVGESVLRTTVFEHDVPARPQSKSYEVYFGPIDAMVLLGETAETHWPLADLAPGVTYGWQVVAYDDCGFSAGPVWRFTTATDAPFRRGDVNGDFGLDISDAINILEELFVGVPSAPLPDCRRSRDVDDSGSLDTTDPVALLSHLYQGTPPPAFPFEECGEDSTADALGCVSYPSCE